MDKVREYLSEEESLWIAEMTLSRARYEAWLTRTAPSSPERADTHGEAVRACSRKLVREARELVAVSRALRQARGSA